MRIIFFGSDIFAVPALERLINSNHEVSLVVTQTDKRKGRHLHFGFSAVKEFALKYHLEIIQPLMLTNADFVKRLKDSGADLFVVAAYGKIIPKEILDIPQVFSINIHGSLLPKYRGAAPINRALINGDKEAGVTIIKMNEFMDAGEVISQESIEISSQETAISLRERLSFLGAELLIKTIDSIKTNNFTLTQQDETRVTLAPKLKKSDGLIKWQEESLIIYNQVRGLLPWPGSFTYFRGKILKIFATEILPLKEKSSLPGEVEQILPDALVVATGSGSLKITSLQLESGKKLSAREFVLGHQIKVGERLG